MHVENILTIGMCGALAFLVIRMVISKLLEPDRSHFAWISIGLCGIAFGGARVVHHSDPDPALALHMVRAQYASAILLPVLAQMTIENLGEMPRSRATTVMWLISLPLSALFLLTPWFVSGPPVPRSDLFGMTFYAGQPGPMLWIILPLGIWMAITLRRRLGAIPPTFASLRRTVSVALITAIVLGANDSLHGAGIFKSVPMFEYSFLVIAIVSTRVELQRSAIVREALHSLVHERDREVESKRQAIDTALHKLTRSEARYRHLAQATREGVVVLQGQRVIDVNDAFLEMLGTTEASLLGADASELVEPTDRPLVEKLVTGGENGPSDMRAYKGDQSLLAVSVKATAVPEGSPGTRVLLVRDISGERELRLQLLRADRLAAVGTLAAGTAHEINNPLVYVVGNAEVLAQELERLEPMLPPGELDLAKEVVGEISIGGDRVRRIVKDLMSLARDRSTDESAVDIVKLLESSLAMAAHQFRHRATVVRELAEVPKVYASEVRLGQVFLNLLVNAAQAIPEGRLAENTVTVKTFAEGDQVIVEIVDTGSGMDPATRDRIFDPFFTTKEVGKGTGLGLSISHGIVSTLGGKIEVESAVDKGSRFRISLPAMAAQVDVATFVPSSEVTPTRRILVVDDEELVARNLARMLSPHRVDVARSGREALDRYASGRYDVVLCDLMMPDVTGMEVYAQTVAADPTAAGKFLFMTGGAFTDKAREFLDQVPARCLEKPISKADLHRAVRGLFLLP